MSATDTETTNRFTLAIRDGEIAGHRFGSPNRPPMLFCHATGMCASVYRQMFAKIGDAYDIFAIDQRGHGLTTLPAEPDALWSWETYARDINHALDAVAAQFGVAEKWVLAGHSMGGVSSLLAARTRSDVTALRLIDPPLMPVPLWLRRSPLWPLFAARMPIVQGARKRRSQWPSREAALESYRGKRFFRHWAPGVLEDYLEDGLRLEPGGARLSCSPEWEAATFSAQRHDVWPAVKAHLSRSGQLSLWGAGGPDSPFASVVRRRMRREGATVTEDAAATHLWPFERPEEAARFLSQSI